MTSGATELDNPHRFPAQIIRHAVWLYFRVPLRPRDVEALLCVRGVVVSYEAIRTWCRQCGQASAHALRQRRPRPGDTWPLDEVCIPMHTARPSLGRAVEQDGTGLAILVQRRRDKKAAQKFFRPLLKGLLYVPRGLITATRQSYGAAKRESWPGVAPRQHRYVNTRAEHAPSPRASGNSAYNGASRLGRPNDFLPRLGRWPNTSARAGIPGSTGPTRPRVGRDHGCSSGGLRAQSVCSWFARVRL